MLDTISRNWWAIALRGVVAILFGLFVFFVPGPALLALIVVFGAYAFIDGILAIAAGFRAARSHERWLQLVLMGIFGVLVGLVTWFYPGLTALTLLYVIAAWAVVTGIMEIIAAFELRRHLPGEWWWLLAGLASVAFGVLLMWHPLVGALAVLWIIGTYAIAAGIFLLGLAWRLREHAHRLPQAVHPV